MSRSVLTLAAALVLIVSPLARAQLDNSPYRGPVDSRGHYQRQRSGTTIDEWARHLESTDPRERIEAVENLGQSEDGRAVNYLLKALNDADPRVQVRAVDFLGDRRASDATPLLVQRLFLTGAPQALRQHVLAALGKIGDPSASRPILDFLAQETNPAVRGTAFYTLGEIGDISIREDLAKIRAGETEPRLQTLADEALAKLGTTSRPKSETFVPPSSGLVPPVRPGN